MFSTKKSPALKKTPNHRQTVGLIGESTAEKHLKDKGFTVIERNFRCKGGELDIVAQKGREIHFIEVKTRRNHSYGEPLEAVNWSKRKKLSHAAQYYLIRNPSFEKWTKSFSVIVVDSTFTPEKVELFENAFEIEGGGY